ncbi:cysteine proteinase [Lindgomyces ingoldianus]|uniref:Cysteine proteinase n=1 Tax=Lindgomyces ingoldianus TaxID=673940 RepID=A0ACB6RB48_9PLEO|nr:cysteine proteinase [Lindgomyces ingoldianus]KAF2476280.1 cysteine proteinase [Lindgomyces ingoldianus]
MPAPHVPPAVPMHQVRRQPEYHYHMPPQTNSPVPHNPYTQYHHHPQHYGAPHSSPYPQQWYPYPQPQHQYPMPPRQYPPHGSPVVVSSHPHMAPIPPVSRQLGQTPPIAHSRTPPAPRNMTPLPTPSTPSVTSQTHVSSPTPPTNMSTPTPPPTTPARPPFTAPPPPPPPPPPTHRMPYYPDLPWLSVPDVEFPPRASQKKRRRKIPVPSTEEGLAFPTREAAVEEEPEKTPTEAPEDSQADESQASTAPAASEIETPSTSHPPSEADSTHPTTPSSSMPPASARPLAVNHTRTATKPAVPLIPIKPVKPVSATSTTQKSATDKEEVKKAEEAPSSTTEPSGSTENTPKASPPPKPAPKSWAELLRPKAPAPAAQTPSIPNGVVAVNGSSVPKSNSLADVLSSFSVDSDKKISFLEPRGLVNSGNLCYMNSILQVLVFCVPFYDFLDQVAKRAVHSFKTETPLVDAMILFMHDFKVIDSHPSVETLRMRLKDTELEQYGDPLTPEYVYDVIKRLPRFDNMKRGQQEDAEEFLGFLLAGLHDECAHVIKSGTLGNGPHSTTSPKSEHSGSVDGGWLEVGPKQKPSVTQSSGAIEIETPVTKIFGGKIRSEYRKPGEKPSVTLEPYQPLQLDIGSPTIHNITDALKGLTHLETLDATTRGARASTKQMFIETLPPVLILHLKRFHYDASGAQKIWKKIGYPLELEIPKDVFPPHKRGNFNVRGGAPRYRLTAVVYHHGKNASGGHYTVDLRRQEGREWIRMDDTVIRRIRAEDVAEGGAEEDPKVLAAALEQHKRDSSRSRNFFEQGGLGEEGEKAEEGGWSQVNGVDKKDTGPKKWSGVVNGTVTPSTTGKRTPLPKESVRDNKVAYILFYQKIEA